MSGLRQSFTKISRDFPENLAFEAHEQAKIGQVRGITSINKRWFWNNSHLPPCTCRNDSQNKCPALWGDWICIAMIGMVLVTHGHLALEFRAALEHVVGPQEQLETITIGPEDDMESRRKDIMDAVCRVNSGHGVVVLTDMFGGTPSNLALSCMSNKLVEVVAGINLPMLIKFASVRDGESLEDAVLHAQEAGRKYINVASRVLAGK